MKTTSAVAESKPYHHGDLRRALLDSATAILEREGPSALSLRAVAREAGVSPAAPYHHFKDKDELLGAIAHQGFIRLKDAMAQAAAAAPDPRKKVAELGAAYVRFARSHPALYRVMYDSARAGAQLPGAEDPDSAFALLRTAVAEAAGNHMSRLDVNLAAIATWCAAHGLAELSGFVQLDPIKRGLGGEDRFVRGVLERLGVFGLADDR